MVKEYKEYLTIKLTKSLDNSSYYEFDITIIYSIQNNLPEMYFTVRD